jgi:hypothetical protein
MLLPFQLKAKLGAVNFLSYSDLDRLCVCFRIACPHHQDGNLILTAVERVLFSRVIPSNYRVRRSVYVKTLCFPLCVSRQVVKRISDVCKVSSSLRDILQFKVQFYYM